MRSLLILGLLLLSVPARCGNDLFYLDPDSPVPKAFDEKALRAEIKELEDKVANGEMPKVQFDFDSDKIRPESEPTLDAVATILLENPHLKLMILAHTCIIGTEKYNLALSKRRAKSVKGYLVQHGVPPPSIRYYGLGFSRPIADNSTEEGREKNRRVEFRFTAREWDSVF